MALPVGYSIPEAVLSQLHRTAEDPRQIVVMTCGCSGAGKSTLAKAIIAALPTFMRISFDGIVHERHGLYGVDYPPSEHEAHADEADRIFHETFARSLKEGTKDIVADRAFYAKPDRDEYRGMAEAAGARVVLVYLKGSKEVLWRRVCERRAKGIDADSMRDLSEEIIGQFVDGFDVPDGEGELVLDVS